jgi:hypothetical protein
MWRYILLFGIVIASPAIGWCDTVQFTVEPVNIGTLIQAPSVDLFASGLNGTALTGQSLSLDLVFSNDVLARLFLSDPTAFGIELIVNTNAGTFPGFAGPTTGFLLDPSGNQFGNSQVAGRADGSDGSFSMGLVSFTSANLNGSNVIDISGMQFDTTFPDDGAIITNADLRFSFNSNFDSVEFGTAQQLPEPSTLGLTLVGAMVLALAAWRRGLKHLSVHVR